MSTDLQPVILLANGREIDPNIFQKTAPADARILAIDGGANQCRRLNIVPDFLLGDFDSIDPLVKELFPMAQILHRPDQDATDMEKALQFALSLNPASLTIYSAFGLRGDHTAGNLLIFQNLESEIPVEIIDNHGIMRVLRPGRHRLSGKPGATFSLFSYRPIIDLSLSGFRYNIPQEGYRSTFLGISNEFQQQPGTVSFSEGYLFYYRLFTNV